MTHEPDQPDGGALHLTVNNRLAAELRHGYDQAQRDAGRRAWASIEVLPWHAWLTRSYERLLDDGYTDRDLLTPAQEQLLWRDAMDASPRGPVLLRQHAAARTAMDAFALCRDWQVDPQALDGHGEETRLFQAWRRAFEARLDRDRLLVGAELMPLLVRAVGDRALPAPAHLVLHGFDAVSPAQRALLDRLAAAGSVVEHRDDVPDAVAGVRVEAVDGEDEIALAAAWARAQLARDPAARIAVVTPQLGELRADLERVFRRTLAPLGYIGLEATPPPFDVSLGTPLAEQPPVADALALLELLAGAQPLATVGRLLRSAFVGGHAAEWQRRALLDAALRDNGRPRLTLDHLLHAAARAGPDARDHCPDLAARLTAAVQWRDGLPGAATPADWAALLQRGLALFGWPGDTPLDSTEFQQCERLQRAFGEFAAFGKVRGRLRQREATALLRQLAADTVFQARARDTRLRILGPLEAAGLSFDALWLLGMTDQAWPPSAAPNPLLPLALQRASGMPHASPAHELEFAARLTARIGAAAPVVVASHAARDGDREQRVSPLFRDWPTVDPARLVGTRDDRLRDACAAAGATSPLPAARVGVPPPAARGGAALLGAQASCPFHAVAGHRLQARPLDEPTHAPDPARVGSLVHDLLQRVWTRLGDSAALAALGAADEERLLSGLARETLVDLGRQRPDLFTPRFVALETARLTRLLGDWLALERQRAQGFRVAALETRHDVEIGGLTLGTRADRIDRLDDGRLAVIDYKTGAAVSSAGWFDTRLTEPQLPLYCVAQREPVGAALLARVRRDRGGCRFVGVSPEDPFAPGVGPDTDDAPVPGWDTLLAQWRAALAGLADEVLRGRADPTPSPQACAHCPHGALCRVEQLLEAADDD